MKFRIRYVDMDGYCGREKHPERSDLGLLVTPVRLEAMAMDHKGDLVDVVEKDDALTEEGKHAVGSYLDDGESTIEWLWVCATKDGRILHLMGHELELFES